MTARGGTPEVTCPRRARFLASLEALEQARAAVARADRERAAALADLVATGVPLRAVAADAGVSHVAVLRWLRRDGPSSA